jgi:hypothetical protein
MRRLYPSTQWIQYMATGKLCGDDYVIVKMDIEGAECDVLEKVIRDACTTVDPPR